ncbi:hypothetical protein Trydic_g687 [Trypoxylus dichotomus]
MSTSSIQDTNLADQHRSARRTRKAYSEDFEIKDQLKQFWEIEEVYPNHISSLDDCEQIFQNTFCRNVEGRFVVSLPLKQDSTILGDSYEQARKRFFSLERKLSMNPQLKEMYTNFMEEYETVGHMTKLESVDNTKPCYYLPHHSVFKESSLTTKLRVDASAPSSSGFSLNDIQLVGPTIQDDLFSILIRFRQHTYAVSADIAKIHRQVLIDPKYRCLQRILWRSVPSKPLHIYQLNTVTYGTASTPYLAVKCLKQLAIEHMDNFPRAANAIVHDFYVDDFLSGSDTVEEAQLLCNQVSQILQGGCFELRKWVSNNPQILTVLNSSKVSSPQVMLFKQSEVKDKTLELLTVLTQVEGILNSRPIFPMSSDPNDLNALTPGHFLIGRPITFLPQPNLLEVKENTLSRYQRLQQMSQHFWTRWSREYISELQQKTKWKSNLGSINVGDLVVIKDDHLPPSRWKLGRITEIQPGKDNVVRVVTIRTSSGQMKRSVTRVCPLPVLNED